MDGLRIEKTGDTPLVSLDPIAGKFIIEGKSVPDDAEEFYGPIFEWMEQYALSPNETTVFELDLEFFNIASSKRILFILYKFGEIAKAGKQVSIKWFHIESDYDMLEVGEDYAYMVKIPFEFIAHKPHEKVSV